MASYRIVTLLALVFLIKKTHSCTCFVPQHPQTEFCAADFVIKGQVKSISQRFDGYSSSSDQSDSGSSSYSSSSVDSSSYDQGNVVYEVVIEKRYKGNRLTAPQKTVEIISSNEFSCEAIELDINQNYILMGFQSNGELSIQQCGYYKRSDEMTTSQLKGLLTDYKKTCKECSICEPATCRFPLDTSTCALGIDDGDDGNCEINFARCDQDNRGSCVWIGDSEYSGCKEQ